MHSHHSAKIKFFRGEVFPQQDAVLAGYAALIVKYHLKVVVPEKICAIVQQHSKFSKDRWLVFGPRYKPDDTLKGQLIFALKQEGIDLALLSALFTSIATNEIEAIVINTPTGGYNRRIWFLYEWLTGKALDIADLRQGSYVTLLNEKQQYAGPVRQISRQRINNNLPGVKGFCPLISRTAKLDALIDTNLSLKAKTKMGRVHADLLSRAAAFLLLKDSKASYTIEGESPPHNRIQRWGKIIGQAGTRAAID